MAEIEAAVGELESLCAARPQAPGAEVYRLASRVVDLAGFFDTGPLFDAGYKLHIDAAVEDMRDSPAEIVVPLTTDGAGKPVGGSRYIADFTYGL